MSKTYFENKNLVTFLCTFLGVDELSLLSTSNKPLNKILNPLDNTTVNKIYYNQVNKKFFEMDEDFDFDKSYKEKRNNLLDIYWNNTFSWKSYLIQFTKHFNNYPDKKITKKFNDIFRIHLYLQDLRKENYHLEFSNSSVYQTFSYDKKFKEMFNYNYYNKFINQEYINKKGKECEIKIKRKGLFFEKELENFYGVYNEINSCDDYKDILEAIISYDFEKLDNFYQKVNKSRINNIILFILWTNRIFKLYCKYILNSVNIFEEDKIGKIYLEEYIDKYTNFINSILLVNSNFENVNLIINYLNLYILKKNDSQKFSLEQLGMKIFKKTVFYIIAEKLFNKTSSLYKNYLINKLENKNEEKNEVKMDIEESETNNTSMLDLSLDDSFSCFQKEKTDKEILENLSKCILDLSINKNNINAINHSSVKIEDSYNIYENDFTKTTNEVIEKELNKDMSISEIFSIIEKIIGNEENSRKNSIKNNNSLLLINKTKKIIFENSIKLLFKNLLKELNNDINSHLKPNMNGRAIYISNLEKINNKDYSEDLSNFSQKKKIKIESKVQNEINKIKDYLYEKNLKGFEPEETKRLVNQYIENNGIKLVLLMKKMIYFYCKECEFYYEKNQKVYDILTNKGKDELEKSSFTKIVNI